MNGKYGANSAELEKRIASTLGYQEDGWRVATTVQNFRKDRVCLPLLQAAGFVDGDLGIRRKRQDTNLGTPLQPGSHRLRLSSSRQRVELQAVPR
ncbi:MAG: hypothetical protein ACLR6J_00255 [Parabacteroides merdae]